MRKIKFTNEVGGKNSILAGIIIVSVLMSILIILLFLNPESVNLIGAIGTITLTGVTAIILFLTLQTYSDLLKVSEQTLSFTKIQTSYNSYFDNYKLFNELSKQKTDILLEGELYSDISPFFVNMTFNTIYINYKTILENYPERGPMSTRIFDRIFTRFNNKIKSFMSIIHSEIIRIKKDNNLTEEQKENLIDLYKSFMLFDYINLSIELIANIQKQSDGIKGLGDFIGKGNLLKCNSPEQTVFDPDLFLSLYYEVKS